MEKEKETFAVIGAAMEVHRILGCGMSEKVYQDALEVEFRQRGIPYVREKHFTVTYKDVVLTHDFYADFYCYDIVVVEIKATSVIENLYKAQVISYLKASSTRVGLLINFGEESLIYERFSNYQGNK